MVWNIDDLDEEVARRPADQEGALRLLAQAHAVRRCRRRSDLETHLQRRYGVTTAGRDYVRGLCWEAVARFCRREGRRLSMRIEGSSLRSRTAQNLSIRESRHSISDPESTQESRGRNNAFIRESRSSTGASRCRAGKSEPRNSHQHPHGVPTNHRREHDLGPSSRLVAPVMSSRCERDWSLVRS